MIINKYKFALIKQYIKQSFDTYKEANEMNGIGGVINTFNENIRNCFNHIKYTYQHSRCFSKLEDFLLGDGNKHRFHDFDKILMYILFPFLGTKCIHNIHRLMNAHHPSYSDAFTIQYKRVNEVDWIEAVIDWECARFTKSDKPLDAYETYRKYFAISKEYEIKISMILVFLGLYAPISNGDYFDLKKTHIMDNFKF